jgi:hypothetical protein
VTAANSTIPYNSATLDRAIRAFRCSPFYLKLLQEMRYNGVSITKIAGDRGVELGYTKRKMPELVAENNMVWLIQVGMLRREVDGQGLTDSFRLTPLGSEVMAALDSPDLSRLRKRDRLLNFSTRLWRSVF